MRRRLTWLIVLVLACVLYLPSSATAQTGACWDDRDGAELCIADLTQEQCSNELNFGYLEGQECGSSFDGACTGIEDTDYCGVIWAGGSESPSEDCSGLFGGEYQGDETTCAAAVPTLPSSGQGAMLGLLLVAGLTILAFRSRRSTV